MSWSVFSLFEGLQIGTLNNLDFARFRPIYLPLTMTDDCYYQLKGAINFQGSEKLVEVVGKPRSTEHLK